MEGERIGILQTEPRGYLDGTAVLDACECAQRYLLIGERRHEYVARGVSQRLAGTLGRLLLTAANHSRRFAHRSSVLERWSLEIAGVVVRLCGPPILRVPWNGVASAWVLVWSGWEITCERSVTASTMIATQRAPLLSRFINFHDRRGNEERHTMVSARRDTRLWRARTVMPCIPIPGNPVYKLC